MKFCFPKSKWLLSGFFLHALFYAVSILNFTFNNDHLVSWYKLSQEKLQLINVIYFQQMYIFLLFTLQIIRVHTSEMMEKASNFNGEARFYFDMAIFFYIQFPRHSIYLITLIGKTTLFNFNLLTYSFYLFLANIIPIFMLQERVHVVTLMIIKHRICLE